MGRPSCLTCVNPLSPRRLLLSAARAQLVAPAGAFGMNISGPRLLGVERFGEYSVRVSAAFIVLALIDAPLSVRLLSAGNSSVINVIIGRSVVAPLARRGAKPFIRARSNCRPFRGRLRCLLLRGLPTRLGSTASRCSPTWRSSKATSATQPPLSPRWGRQSRPRSATSGPSGEVLWR